MTQLVFRAKPVLFIRSVGFATFFPQLVGPAGNLFVRGSGMVCRALAELLWFRYLHKSKTAGGLTLGRIQKRVKSGEALACCCYTCAMPPSANNSMPVTKLESSEARKTATFAISSGCPMRPSGTCEASML